MPEPPPEAKVNCSFCGKSQDEVRKLVAGPSVYICDECIDLCNDLIAEECEREEPTPITRDDPLPPVSACIVCRMPKVATTCYSCRARVSSAAHAPTPCVRSPTLNCHPHRRSMWRSRAMGRRSRGEIRLSNPAAS